MITYLRPLEISDITATLAFTDQWIGVNYYSSTEMQEILAISCQGSKNASLGAFAKSSNGEGHNLVGVRLTFAPGAWITKKGRGISPDLWQVGPERVAYFKSLFVRPDFQQLGIGRQLSEKSIAILQEMGARAIVCHSWLESPRNSSQAYLSKMGFTCVAVHPMFWHEIDYLCTRCAPGRCVCTAMEMIKYLN